MVSVSPVYHMHSSQPVSRDRGEEHFPSRAKCRWRKDSGDDCYTCQGDVMVLFPDAEPSNDTRWAGLLERTRTFFVSAAGTSPVNLSWKARPLMHQLTITHFNVGNTLQNRSCWHLQHPRCLLQRSHSEINYLCCGSKCIFYTEQVFITSIKMNNIWSFCTMILQTWFTLNFNSSSNKSCYK